MLFTPIRPEGSAQAITGSNYLEARISIDDVLRQVLLDADLSTLPDAKRNLLSQRYGLEDGQHRTFKDMADGDWLKARALSNTAHRAFLSLGLLQVKREIVKIGTQRSTGNLQPAGGDPSTQELVFGTQAVTTEAFEEFYRITGPRIVAFLTSRLGDSQAAEDLTSITFEKFYRYIQINGFEDRGLPIEAFLFRIARNEAVSLIRKSANRDATTEIIDERMTTEDFSPNVDAQVDNSRMLAEIRTAITTLPESERRVMIARFLLDLTVEETAALLGKTQNNVKVTQSKAVAKIKRQLGVRT